MGGLSKATLLLVTIATCVGERINHSSINADKRVDGAKYRNFSI